MHTFWFNLAKCALRWLACLVVISLASPTNAQVDHEQQVDAFLSSISDLKPFLSVDEFAEYEAKLETLSDAEHFERLHALAFDYVLRYQFDEYNQTLPRLGALAERTGALKMENSVSIFEALIELEGSGNYELAANRLGELADQHGSTNDQKLMALISLAYTQSDAQKNAQAAEVLREIITLSRDMDLTLNQRIDIASVSEYVLSGVGDHKGAFDALIKLPDLYKELGLPVDRVWALSKLVEYFLSTGAYEKAIAPNEAAIALAIEYNNPMEMLHQYHYCGAIYTELKRFPQAADCMLKAEPYMHLIEEREFWWLQMTTNALIQSERLVDAKVYFARLEEKIAADGVVENRDTWTQEIRARLLHAEGAHVEAFAMLSNYADAQLEELNDRNEENAAQLRLLMSEEAEYLRQNESLNRQIIDRQRWIVYLIASAAALAFIASYLLWRNRNALMQSAERNEILLNQTKNLATQLSEEVKRNDHLARYDELTGLLNRRGFFERLSERIAEAERRNLTMVFGVLDLDRFKSVNDVYGHAIGDRLLQEVAKRLTTLFCDDAIIGRLGGDEFAVALPVGLNVERAQKIGHDITATLAEKAYLNGVMLRPGASVGFAAFPEMAKDGSQLYANADIALYAAKEKRRGSVSFFDSALKEKSQRRALIEHALNAAEESQFHMEYQPIFQADGETPVAVEALARWNHPEFGTVSPGEFIPIAERNGAMVRLSKVFLSMALEDAANWNSDIRLSVNLSAIDLSSLEHARDLRTIILGSNVDPANITLEVTETAVIKDRALTHGALSLFREIGVKVALDDFGTGHASFLHLRHLPIDQLKVDRTLTAEIEHDYATRRIVKTIVDMCHVLELDCVVEGVSDANKLRELKKMKARHLQGFHLARPMNAEKVAEMLLGATRAASCENLHAQSERNHTLS